MALEDRVWQGHYGEAFVRGLACAAGLVTSKKDLDVDGVDIQIGFPGWLASVRHPAIEAQVKSWSEPNFDEVNYRYPLEISNYDNLVGSVGTDFPLPRFLFLVIVPEDKNGYTSASNDCLLLHHAAYWVSLMEEIPAAQLPNTSSKTVYVPRRNLLTVDALLDLLSPGSNSS